MVIITVKAGVQVVVNLGIWCISIYTLLILCRHAAKQICSVCCSCLSALQIFSVKKKKKKIKTYRNCFGYEFSIVYPRKSLWQFWWRIYQTWMCNLWVQSIGLIITTKHTKSHLLPLQQSNMISDFVCRHLSQNF